MTSDELVQALHSDSETGLSMTEALTRLHSNGLNKFDIEEKVCVLISSCYLFSHMVISIDDRSTFVGNI